MHWDLPEPDPAALAHSATLNALICERIAARGGWIPFADYMDLALYAPGLGYYSAGAAKFGPAGDFITAPEISPLFSQCLAGQCAAVLAALGDGVVIEPGAGRGVMAAAILEELQRLDCLPERYWILEPSAELRQRQAATLERLPAGLAARVGWLERAPAAPLRGVIVANEVVDALPVQRFVIRSGTVRILGVTQHDGVLAEEEREADAGFAAAVMAVVGDPARLPDGYTSELSVRVPAWTATLAEWLSDGVALLIDYGFSRREYYSPERRSGTLRCYYRHRAHDNALLWPGLQDITAWVDFTQLAEAARAAGWEVAGYTTQAHFLLGAGLEAQVARMADADVLAQTQMAAGLRQLLMPGEMGDAIKVMALLRGAGVVPDAVNSRDMRTSL